MIRRRPIPRAHALIRIRLIWYAVFWFNALFSAWQRNWYSAAMFALAPLGSHWFTAVALKHIRRVKELEESIDEMKEKSKP
jgi:hypothetical protein